MKTDSLRNSAEFGLRKAERTIKGARILGWLGFYEWSVFLSQQATEFAFKALWLLIKRGPAPKTHMTESGPRNY